MNSATKSLESRSPKGPCAQIAFTLGDREEEAVVDMRWAEPLETLISQVSGGTCQ